jgi:hypothetical protein
MDKPNVTIVPISEVKGDAKNANKGTKRGRRLLESSLRRLGAGRSILLDKNNIAIGGNKTVEAAESQGYKKVIVVETDGDTLVAVKRKDLDVNDKRGRELAIADNRVGELDLDWDLDALKETDFNISELFNDQELEGLAEGDTVRRTDTIDTQRPPKKIWILLGVPFDRFDVIQEHLAALEKQADISVQSARNE